MTIFTRLVLLTAFLSGTAAQAQTKSEIYSRVTSSPLESEVKEFYSTRDFAPTWLSSGKLNAKAHELRSSIALVSTHGLVPKDYWSKEVEAAFSAPLVSDPTAVEIALTRAYVLPAVHINVGRVQPGLASPEIKFTSRRFSGYAKLVDGLKDKSIGEVWKEFAPRHARYAKLQILLAQLREIANRQPFAPISPASITLKIGVRHPTVRAVKTRVALMGYSIGPVDDYYDEALSSAIKRIQSTNLAPVTGTLSPKDSGSWEFFSVNLARRIQQTELSMEKLRWLPEQLETRHVFVNLATQRMQVVDPNLRNLALIDQNIIVGRVDRKTPSMREDLEYVVLNPTWTIPPDIYRLDKVPAIQEQARFGASSVEDWFSQNRFTLLDSKEIPISPTDFDWLSAPPRFGEVFIRQQPGTDNALGTMKFMMPNPYSIYLHDTNAPELLSEHERAKSSGCIRLSYPREFAEYLLTGTKWNRAAIDDFVVKPGETRETESWIRLPKKEKVPVYILSITADLGSDGAMNFTRDIYGQNLALLKALQAAGWAKQ